MGEGRPDCLHEPSGRGACRRKLRGARDLGGRAYRGDDEPRRAAPRHRRLRLAVRHVQFHLPSATGSGSAPEIAASALAYFEERRRPFSWWLGPADQPRDLGRILDSAGLQRAETELAMLLPLVELPADLPAVPGLEVRRVIESGELQTFAELSAANWTPPDSNVISFYRRAASALLRPDSPQWLYVGYVEGVPVATAEATVADGTAGLYNISTRPSHRGRGIGSMMTWRPLRDARERGCDLGVLQAAPEGVSIYRRLGFRPFGEITEFKPRSADAAGKGT